MLQLVSRPGAVLLLAAVLLPSAVAQSGFPVLSISLTHTGVFTRGQQDALYTAVASNQYGARPTFGTVEVSITVPPGLALASLSAPDGPAVAPLGPLQYLTLSTSQARPFVSTLNSYLGEIVANPAIVPAGAGAISAFVSDATHLILDLNAYFAPTIP